jgi:uncharacterized protein DUF6883
MRLPNGEHAIIEVEKILNYVLNPLHRDGRHHAVLFNRLLGINLNSRRQLDDALRAAARDGDATIGQTSEFGKKYEIRFRKSCVGSSRRGGIIRSFGSSNFPSIPPPARRGRNTCRSNMHGMPPKRMEPARF